MQDLAIKFADTNILIPYRTYDKEYLPNNEVKKLCLQSRSHDGYRREEALKKLLSLDLDNESLPFILYALSDYVLEISQLPIYASEKNVEGLKTLVRNNGESVEMLKQVIISYWNEYYRDIYSHYNDYPPYAFLKNLQIG